MLGHLYRYPHPLDATGFIYCGQGAKRDGKHRSGKSSFGRRFKRDFPSVELSQPIKEQVEVIDQEHLNSMETAWMILYRTLRGYEGGMNILLPGSRDYENIGRIGGLMRVENGQIHRMGTTESRRQGGLISGHRNVESGQFASIAGMGGLATNATTGGRKSNGGRIVGLAHKDTPGSRIVRDQRCEQPAKKN